MSRKYRGELEAVSGKKPMLIVDGVRQPENRWQIAYLQLIIAKR
jgi:hypothetical protein